ncbi:MAG: LL-diaminopimelate aminotransferase [Candidatus Parcubacteria bacterium]
MRLAKRLDGFPEYIHSRMAKAAAEVEKQTGRAVLRFGAGSPDVPPSQKYVSKFEEFLHDKNAHLYPGYRGTLEFETALIQHYQKRFGVTLDNDEVLPLLGAKDGIAHLPLVLLDTGDEFLVPDPGYPAFTEPATMIGGIAVTYDLIPEKHFKIDIEELRLKITARSKYIWVNFPSNPTGQYATLEDLAAILKLAQEHDLIVIHDNCYSEIAFDDNVPPSILQLPGAKDRCVELNSFSKVFSFAGYRMGWLVGNREIVQALAKVKSQLDSGMSLPLQRLGAYALTETDMEWHNSMIKSYRDRRDVIANKLRTLGLTFELPKAALYIWAKIPDSAKDSESYCMQLLKEKQVLFTPGSAFGKNGLRYVRISICVNVEDIDSYL